MRENEVWAKRVVAAIGRIADLAFQHRAWLGHGPEVASFLETYNTLYDQAFENFLVQTAPEWAQTGLPRAVRQEMIRLNQLLEAYQVVGEDVDILADPTWHEVVHQAQLVCQTIGEGAPNARQEENR